MIGPFGESIHTGKTNIYEVTKQSIRKYGKI